MADYNGDLQLVAHQIGEMGKSIDKLDTRVTNTLELNTKRLTESEKQSALQQQSMEAVCKKIEDLDSDVKKINLLSKVIGGIAGGLAVIAAAIGISK